MIKNRGVPHGPLVPPYVMCRGVSVCVSVPLPNSYNRNKVILSFFNNNNIYAYTIHSTPLYTIGGGTSGTGGTLVFERLKKAIEPSNPNALGIGFFHPIFSPIMGLRKNESLCFIIPLRYYSPDTEVVRE